MSQFFLENSSNLIIGEIEIMEAAEAVINNIVAPNGFYVCVNCDVPSPQLQCVDCTCELKERVYCNECSQVHSKVKAFRGHNFQPISRPSAGSHKKCQHGKETRNCKLCGGSRICEHGKYKTICKECVGKNICIHLKIKQHCSQCDGSGLCCHLRQKRACKECKGVPYKKNRDPMGSGSHTKCEHNRERRSCRECGGNRVCIHGRFKYACRDCGTGKPSRKRPALNNNNNNNDNNDNNNNNNISNALPLEDRQDYSAVGIKVNNSSSSSSSNETSSNNTFSNSSTNITSEFPYTKR